MSSSEIEHVTELIAEWRLLADLSFADLLLWLPIRRDEKSWPEGYIAVAQIRPTTAATVFTEDLIGTEINWGDRPLIDQALSSGEIIRDAKPELVGQRVYGPETETSQVAVSCHFPKAAVLYPFSLSVSATYLALSGLIP